MRGGSGGENEDVKEKRRKEHKKKGTTKLCERVGDVRGGRSRGKWWVGGMDGWMDR